MSQWHASTSKHLANFALSGHDSNSRLMDRALILCMRRQTGQEQAAKRRWLRALYTSLAGRRRLSVSYIYVYTSSGHMFLYLNLPCLLGLPSWYFDFCVNLEFLGKDLQLPEIMQLVFFELAQMNKSRRV